MYTHLYSFSSFTLVTHILQLLPQPLYIFPSLLNLVYLPQNVPM